MKIVLAAEKSEDSDLAEVKVFVNDRMCGTLNLSTDDLLQLMAILGKGSDSYKTLTPEEAEMFNESLPLAGRGLSD